MSSSAKKMLYTIVEDFRKYSFYIKNNEGLSALLFGIAVLTFLLLVQQYRRKRKLPPGPYGVPILGYYPFLRKDPQKTLSDVAKKYGNVVGLYIGPQYVVILNDWKALKDGYSQSATLDRLPGVFEAIPFHLGLAGANGEEWHQTRRLTSRAMNDIGLQSTRWEELVREEVLELVDRIKQEEQRPIEVRSFFSETFTNNIVSLVLGERLYAGNSITKCVAESVNAITEYTPTFSMNNYSPALSKVLQALGVEKTYLMFEKVHEMCTVVSSIIDEKLRSRNSIPDDSFIIHFHKEIEKHNKNKEKTYITEENLKGSSIALLAGGSESGRTSTIWALIAMADHPDIQQKVQEELDQVVGKDGAIRWSDRFKIPYTLATFMESMRWKTMAPFPAPRVITADIQIQGYNIPKGTFLVTNTCSIHNDPKYWKNPDQFIPERFLDDDGRKANTSPESFNLFSYGKRNCPGKLIAMMENFQYFSVFMQKFKVIPKDGDKVKYDTNLGLTYEAKNVELRFIPR